MDSCIHIVYMSVSMHTQVDGYVCTVSHVFLSCTILKKALEPKRLWLLMFICYVEQTLNQSTSEHVCTGCVCNFNLCNTNQCYLSLTHVLL